VRKEQGRAKGAWRLGEELAETARAENARVVLSLTAGNRKNGNYNEKQAAAA
jgi:hypothetical protein